jgi:hypothetical protein
MHTEALSKCQNIRDMGRLRERRPSFAIQTRKRAADMLDVAATK